MSKKTQKPPSRGARSRKGYAAGRIESRTASFQVQNLKVVFDNTKVPWDKKEVSMILDDITATKQRNPAAWAMQVLVFTKVAKSVSLDGGRDEPGYTIEWPASTGSGGTYDL